MQGLKQALLTIWRLIKPYATSRDIGEISIPLIGPVRLQERWIGIGFFITLALINLFQVSLVVRLNYFSRDVYNALQELDADAFWYQLFFVFAPLVTVFVAVAIIEIVIQYVFHIRWRRWMTHRYIDKWLASSAHYKMMLTGNNADNPDQRIAEDINLFIANTRNLSLGLLSQIATLVSFAAILWTLSADFTLPGTDIPVPGLLLWIALVYALVGTWLTHLIGKPLIKLSFTQQRYEADFRFSLARLREYGEQVALLSGEGAEKERLSERFKRIVDNYMEILSRQKKLTMFTAAFFQVNDVVPLLITAPYLFVKKITFGQMMQTVSAFRRVEGALTFFISVYTSLADYKAVIDRLASFEDAIDLSHNHAHSGIAVLPSTQNKQENHIVVANLDLRVPSNRTVMNLPYLSFKAGERTLVTGPSGIGKSTLFRAIAGIWPFGDGTITIPEKQHLMLLPQRPYIPIGPLIGAVTYPSSADAFDRKDIEKALETVRLPQLVAKLDDDAPWGQTLSLGEQQRLAIARALLARPDWLLLDEATAALDEPTEQAIYTLLDEILLDTTIISIGHRSTLDAFHDRRIALSASGVAADTELAAV